MHTKKKRIWAVELDLLKKFMEVCDKYHLRYYPSGGTLLGCIRHGGFIPWDDDIDIDMPREDFEKLAAVADKEFLSPYFLQTAHTDPGYFSGHAKLRNSNTTGMIPEDAMFDYNKGIFIDIFPLDFIPDNCLRAKYFCSKVAVFRNVIILGSPAYDAYPHRIIGKILRPLCKFIYVSAGIRRLSGLYDRLCRKYEKEISFKRIAPISAFPMRDKVWWDKKLFAQTEKRAFAHLMIPIPSSYDTILKQQFGAYWIPKKEESQHSTLCMDPDTPYRDFEEFRKKSVF